MNSRHDPPKACARLLVSLPPDQAGMFRFLLEARDNLALFTALDPKKALIKLMFAPESMESVIEALTEIKNDISLEWTDWPAGSYPGAPAGKEKPPL